MSKIISVEQAINKALTLLAFEEYKNPDDVIIISRKLIAQIHILELKRSGLTNTQIGANVDVNEKTIRMWLNADHCPSLKHAIALERLYERKRKAR